MITICALAIAMAVGVDPRRLFILGTAIFFPVFALVGLVPVFMAMARRGDSAPALFCEGIASELRSGAALREAIAVSATAVGATELARSARQRSVEATASATASAFPRIGRELEIVVSRAGSTGAGSADLFDEIGALALAQDEIRREVRVAVAPARAAAAIFVILPGGFILSRWGSGSLGGLVTTGAQRAMGSIGLTMFVLGALVAGALLWRSR